MPLGVSRQAEASSPSLMEWVFENCHKNLRDGTFGFFASHTKKTFINMGDLWKAPFADKQSGGNVAHRLGKRRKIRSTAELTTSCSTLSIRL